MRYLSLYADPEARNHLGFLASMATPTKDIAQHYGVHESTARYWINRLGLTNQYNGRGRPWTADETAEAVSMRRAGTTHKVIARLLARTEKAVGSRLFDLGITGPRGGARR